VAYRSFSPSKFEARGARKVTTGITGLWQPSARPTSGYFDQNPQGSTSNSNPLSRRTSEEDQVAQQGLNSGLTSGQHTPEHIDYSDLALNKVPSYTTAIRAPVRGMSYSDAEALPNYDAAISAPPSPVWGSLTGATTPGANEPSSYGNGSSTPTTPVLEMSNGRTRPRNPLAGMGLTPIAGSGSQDADAGRRLHLIQARGRAH